MGKTFIIARSNMRKAKGQTAALIALVIIASFMFNLWLMLSMDYKANFDRYHDKLNAEHVTVVSYGSSAPVEDFMTELLDGDNRVAQYCLTDCMFAVGTFPYNGGVMNAQFVFTEKAAALTRRIGRAEIVETGAADSGVYMPMIYKSDETAVGKTVEITIGSRTVEYDVCGFFNSVMMGSHNCSLTQIILTGDKYAELEATGCASPSALCSVRLKDKSINLNYESELKARIAERFNDARMASNCYDIVSQSRYISQMICSGIVSAMAFFVLLIALVVIASNIVNYIQVNIKNLGALKAAGYTSRQLVTTLLAQFLFITVVAALAGAGLSYCVFPAVNTMMIAQTGIPYAVKFLPLPLLISVAILCGAVALVVWLASRKIKRIEPIAALRQGVRTHNFKRNRVPLESTVVPLNGALALKTTLAGIKHNVVVCITMLVFSLVVVFSGLMIENVIVDQEPFINLIVGETSDSCINIRSEIERDFLSTINADKRVQKAYVYNSVNVAHVGGAELMATMCDDFSRVNNLNVVYKGRFPKYDNEIAIAAKYAKANDFEIGDLIEITSGGKTYKYLISGFTQISNNLGRDCLLTRSGYERLGTLSDISYYVNLADGVDIDAFNIEYKTKFAGFVNVTVNMQATFEGMGSVYISLVTIIVVAILILSALIIAFVLYLLTRTTLNNKMRDYGILKAIGFTTKQLILQTSLSFMPAVVLSTVLGLVLSSVIITALTALFLSGIGIVKCTFNIPIAFNVAAGFGLIAASFALACLMSLRIRKISPKNILAAD